MDDITESKQMEEELQKSYDELEQKNRELVHFNKLFVNRELKMVELKKRIRELENAVS